MYLYNQWYLAAWDDAVGEDPVQIWLLDIPVMFYRTAAGQLVATSQVDKLFDGAPVTTTHAQTR